MNAEVATAPRLLAVIIPMFNEELNAERCVRTVLKSIASLPETTLYVVNDGSADRTLEILRRLVAEGIPFQIVDHGRNLGYGAALLTGARQALKDGFDFGLFMDSDLTNDPALIPAFIAKVRTGKFDLVKASRYIPTGGMSGVPQFHQLLTKTGNLLARTLFGMGIRDCTNGFRAVRLSMIAPLQFQERGFPVIMEELYLLKRSGARATEIPYILTARKKGEGESKMRYRPALFYRYLKYAVLAAFVRSSR